MPLALLSSLGHVCVPADPDAAAIVARTVGYPAVLKILSEDISHKSDVGGVALHLEDEATLLGAARTMLARLAHEQPNARIQGFTVQSMVQRRHAQELIVGSTVDPVLSLIHI